MGLTPHTVTVGAVDDGQTDPRTFLTPGMLILLRKAVDGRVGEDPPND